MNEPESNLERPLVSIIVPTKNSASTMGECLASIAAQLYESLEVLVVDNDSSDATREIAKEYDCLVLSIGPERSAQRNHGARISTGSHLLFVDSDMVLAPTVVEECATAARSGATAVIIPEVSFGDGFWSRCKALERSCYVGDASIEAARFFDRDLFEGIGGYDEDLTGPEDWDLHERAIRARAQVARTTAVIRHDEGRLKLRELARKKFYYGKTLGRYIAKHHETAGIQLRIVRPAFIRHRRRLAGDPLPAVGMFVMKLCEGAAGAAGLLAGRLFSR